VRCPVVFISDTEFSKRKNDFKTVWLKAHFFEIDVFAMGICLTPFRNYPGYHGLHPAYDWSHPAYDWSPSIQDRRQYSGPVTHHAASCPSEPPKGERCFTYLTVRPRVRSCLIGNWVLIHRSIPRSSDGIYILRSHLRHCLYRPPTLPPHLKQPA
jgi:hypothetical protein